MSGLRKYPGSSGAEKLLIPDWFAIVLNTFGRPVRFHFFLVSDRASTDRRAETAVWKVSVQYCNSLCEKIHVEEIQERSRKC